jgi:hypothetical protein
MAKRFIERPTARQIMTEADRQVMRDQRNGRFELAREKADAWLAENYAAPAPAPRAPKGEVDSFTRTIIEHDRWLTAQENWNENPDPLGKTGHYEPKSIHDPVPPSRISRIAPKKRKGRDPYACSEDCELPEYRTRKTYTIEDASGRAVGAIEVNQFAKRIRIGGSGLIDRPDRLRHLGPK